MVSGHYHADPGGGVCQVVNASKPRAELPVGIPGTARIASLVVAVTVVACSAQTGGGGGGSATTRAATPHPTPTAYAVALPGAAACAQVPTPAPRADVIPAAAMAPNAIRAVIPTPSSPQGFAADGTSVWVVTHRSSDIYRIDPSTNRAVAIPYTEGTPDSGVFAISAGPHGVFVAIGHDDVVDRIDTAANTVVPFAHVRGAEFVTDTPHGVWVAATSENGQLVHELDPGTGRVLASIAVGEPGSLDQDPISTAYAAGSLWVAPQSRPILIRVDVVGARVTGVVSLPAPAITLDGSSSAVYAGLGDNSVVRVDPGTDCVAAAVAVGPPPAHARDLTFIPLTVDAVGVRITYGAGDLALLDPTSLAVRSAVRVDGQDFEGGAISAFGSVWFATFNRDTVLRLSAINGQPGR